MGTPLLFDEANFDSWIPITVLALNLVGIIGFGVYSIFAIPIILITSGFIKFLINLDLSSFLYGGAKYQSGWVSILYLLAAGLTSWALKNYTINQARRFDDSMSFRLSDLEQKRSNQVTRELNQSVARKLHESVLNTLSSIQRLRDGNQLSQVGLIAKRDLDSLDEITQKIKPISLDELINIAILRSGLEEVEIIIKPDCEVEVSIETLPALQHSLIEALRNIDRHSRASKVEISWSCSPDRIILTVTDDGLGFDPDSVAGGSYGLQVIQNSTLQKLGHHVEINSVIGAGTQVIWSFVELATRQDNSEPIAEWPRLTQDNIVFRYLFLVIPFFIGTLSVMLTSGFRQQEMAVLHYFVYLLMLATYATVEPSKLRNAILPFLITAIFWGQYSLIDQVSTCVEALPIQWLVNGYTVGILLIVMSSINKYLKPLFLLGNTYIIANVAYSLRKCQEIALLPGITGLVLSIGIIYGLNAMAKRNLATIAEYQVALDDAMERELKQQAADLTFLRMQSLTQGARELLERMQDPNQNFELLKSESQIQEAYLRSALQIMESTRDDIQEVLLVLLSQLAQQGVKVSVENWSQSLDDVIWPAELVSFGYELSESLHEGICKLTFIDQGESVYLVVEGVGRFEHKLQPREFVSDLSESFVRAELALPIARYTSQQIEQ